MRKEVCWKRKPLKAIIVIAPRKMKDDAGRTHRDREGFYFIDIDPTEDTKLQFETVVHEIIHVLLDLFNYKWNKVDCHPFAEKIGKYALRLFKALR